MSARAFSRACKKAGLCCIGHELINWGVEETLTDCLSIATRHGSRFAGRRLVRNNSEFMNEALNLRVIASLYGRRRLSKQDNGVLDGGDSGMQK
jgi:hypothetical protein